MIQRGVGPGAGRRQGGGGKDLLLSGLGRFVLDGAFKFFFDAGGGFFEFANRFADSARKFGKFFPAEEHQRDD